MKWVVNFDGLLRRWREWREFCRRFDEEADFHIEESIASNLRCGMTARAARKEALRRFGNRRRLRRELWQNLRAADSAPKGGFHALLTLPGIAPAALALLSLALLAVSPLSPLPMASILGRLPLPEARTLIRFTAQERGDTLGFSSEIFGKFHAAHRESAAYRYDHFVWYGRHGPLPVVGVRVSPNFFQLLGMRPMLGQIFGATNGDQQNVVLSYRFWLSQFHGDRSLIGRAIQIDDTRARIVAVLPRKLWFVLRGADIWMPSAVDDTNSIAIIARSAGPAITMAMSRELASADSNSSDRQFRIQAVSLTDLLLDDLAFLSKGWLAVFLVIVCAALADLMRIWRKQRRWARPVLYWTYALISTASVCALMLVVGAHLLELIPRIQFGESRLWSYEQMTASLIGLPAYVLLSYRLLQWRFDDLRYRCRTCLRRLRMPVAKGRLGGVLLSSPTTEYVCLYGHGRLAVGDQRRASAQKDEWSFAQDLWYELAHPQA